MFHAHFQKTTLRKQILLVYIPLLLLSGCAEKEASRECFAMDTVMQLRAYGPQAAAVLDAAEQEIYRL